MNDAERVLEMFQQQPGKWVNHRHIIVDMGISEYSGRIGGARNLIKCTHGDRTKKCTSDKHIINVKKGWYVYTTSRQSEVKMDNIPFLLTDKIDLQQKRKELLEQLFRELSIEKRQEIIKTGKQLKEQIQCVELTKNVKEALL